jgi:hypothetical protein
LIKPVGERGAELFQGGQIDFPGRRHDQRRTRWAPHVVDVGSQRLLVDGIPSGAETTIGAATGWLAHRCTISCGNRANIHELAGGPRFT